MSTHPWRQPALPTVRHRTSTLLIMLATLLMAGSLGIAPSAEAASESGESGPHQQLTTTLLPPVRQSGALAAPLGAARTVVAANVEPAAAGRTVRLQLWRHGWRNVAKDVTTRRGLVE